MDSVQNEVINQSLIVRKTFNGSGKQISLVSEERIILDSCGLDDSIRYLAKGNEARITKVAINFFDGQTRFGDSIDVVVINGSYPNEYGCIIWKEYKWHPVLGFFSIIDDNNSTKSCPELEGVEITGKFAYQINCELRQIAILKNFSARLCGLRS